MSKVVKDVKKKIFQTIIFSLVAQILVVGFYFFVNKEDLSDVEGVKLAIANALMLVILFMAVTAFLIKEVITYPIVKQKAHLKFKKNFFYFKRSFELLSEDNIEKGRSFFDKLPNEGYDFFTGYLLGMSVIKFPENPYGLNYETFKKRVEEISNEDYST
jgi:hypothetical protein